MAFQNFCITELRLESFSLVMLCILLFQILTTAIQSRPQYQLFTFICKISGFLFFISVTTTFYHKWYSDYYIFGFFLN